MKRSSSASMTFAFCAIVLGTGCSALIFESLWFRQAGLALGNSVWATSVVLSAFMAGLALGNFVAARRGDAVTRPLMACAALEATIAIAGTALVFVLPAIAAALAPWQQPLLDRPWLQNGARLGVAFLLLLIPSTAMGTTLPLLTRALTSLDARFGTVLGKLYGWNTLGGVLGVVLGEAYLIDAFGIRGTALAAAVLSLTAAGLLFWLDRRSHANPAKAGFHDSTVHDSTVHGSAVHSRTVHKSTVVGSGFSRSQSGPVVGSGFSRSLSSGPWALASFASGFCLLALEVIWFRLLLLFVMGNSLAFALMLAVVLTGVGLGGLIAANWLRRDERAFRAVADLSLVSGVLTVVTYIAFPSIVRPFEGRLIDDAAGIVRVGLPLMLPVSLCSGMFFTFAGAALRHRRPSAADTTGRLTLANTAGAALGSLAGGFALLPVIGVERSLFAIAVLYVVTGLWLMRGGARTRGTVYVLGAAIVGFLLFPFGAMEEQLVQATARRYDNMRRSSSAETAPATVAAVREGLTETIVYLNVEALRRPLFYQMFTNAIAMADTEFHSRRYMKLYAYWPMAVHPDVRRALLICYGIGNTAKALTDSKTPESIDIVDISRDVLDSNRVIYPDAKDSPLSDPRVRVHIEDGRYFLQATNQQFDLITAEPPPPTAAGAVNLYTREYFGLLRNRLAEGGVVAYWLPLQAMSDVATKSVLRAFCDVFENCSLWNGMGAQLMMIGSRGPLTRVSEAAFVRQWQQPTTAVEMKRLGLERPEQLGALFIGDAEYLRELTEGALPTIDDRPKRIEAGISGRETADRFVASLADAGAARERFARSEFIRELWPERFVTASAPYFEAQGLINAFAYGGRVSIQDVHRLLTTTPLTTPPLWFLGSDWDTQQAVIDASPTELARPDMQWHLGLRLVAERSFVAAAEMLRRAEGSPAHRTNAFGVRVYAMAMSGRVDAAKQLVRERLTAAELEAPFWLWMRQTFGL